MFVTINSLAAVRDYYINTLKEIYSDSEIDLLFSIAVEHFLGFSKSHIRMHPDQRLSESELLDLHFTLKRLKKHEPIQYILERADFFGLVFKVNQHTLIPRPETEELVDLAIKQIPESGKVLDIGTGSGCIPIALKKNRLDLTVFATDISEEALNLAKKNSLEIVTEISFFLSDILNNQLTDHLPSNSLDCIISNPPYIGNSEKAEMNVNVLDFEPHLALFVQDSDPLIFYKRIASLGRELLKPKGQIMVEINQKFGKECLELFENSNYSKVTLIKDLNNNDRIIHAIL